ncbi:acetyl-CoA carboxylase biotin carboxylase subunit family protein [Micromonospora maritima]|uniref:acetyl-CoA carboxylase biotin carboxylase subunit family protein n=1 Tax=Micromonospora maritima TaxID=986711 RepID=UPI00379D2381
MTTAFRPRVLLVGWSGAAYDALAALGCDVTAVIDGKHRGKARAHGVDTPVVVTDTSNAESVLSGLSRHDLAPDMFETIASQSEFALVTASLLAAVGGTGGIPLPTAVALRDKFVQKRLVREAGLPVTECRVVADLGTEPAAGWSWPVVVKPLAGGGSRDTFLLRGPADLAEITAQLSPVAGPWLVEDFVPGTELHIDGVVQGGELRLRNLSRYLQNVIEIHSGGLVGSAMLDPAADPGLHARIGELCTSVLRALNHRDGVFHIEVFDHDGHLTFSECAGRIGGGMVPESVRHRHGIDLFDSWARLLLGQPLPQQGEPGKLCGWVQLPAPPGRVTRLPTVAALLERPGCVEARLVTREGGDMPDITAASNLKAGAVVVEGDSTAQVEQRLLDLVNWFRSQSSTAPIPAQLP